jgi:hypothetical protein
VAVGKSGIFQRETTTLGTPADIKERDKPINTEQKSLVRHEKEPEIKIFAAQRLLCLGDE